MATLFDFQLPESHKIIFCWDADVRSKSEISPISVFKNFEFPAPYDMALVKSFIFFANRNSSKNMQL